MPGIRRRREAGWYSGRWWRTIREHSLNDMGTFNLALGRTSQRGPRNLIPDGQKTVYPKTFIRLFCANETFFLSSVSSLLGYSGTPLRPQSDKTKAIIIITPMTYLGLSVGNFVNINYTWKSNTAKQLCPPHSG